MATWILAQLEEYHTGLMIYGTGLWGVLEALYSTALIHFITAFNSISFWHEEILLFRAFHTKISPIDILLSLISISCIIQSSGQIYRIINFNETSYTKKVLIYENLEI